MTLTPKQRAKRMAKAHGDFERAFVVAMGELRGQSDTEHQQDILFAAGIVIRQLRIDAEAEAGLLNLADEAARKRDRDARAIFERAGAGDAYDTLNAAFTDPLIQARMQRMLMERANG